MQRTIVFACAFILLFSIMPVLVHGGDVSTFEVNVLEEGGSAEPIIRVSVQDSFFFGNVSAKGVGDEIRITVNNTGNVAVIVTPELIDKSEKIFNYTYFRFRQSSSYPIRRIGEFSFNISKPGTSGVSSEFVWAMLNLTDYPEEISDDMIGHRADVKFVAIKQ